MKLKVLSWKEIKTAGEKKLESELRRISRTYAERARTLEKSIGTEMFEAAYGKRLTAKQIRDTLINESDGRFKFRKAYQRWTNKGNMNIYKKLDYETRLKRAEDRFPRLETKKSLELLRREEKVVSSLKEELFKKYGVEFDTDDMSDIIIGIVDADPTQSITKLSAQEHEYETVDEARVNLLEKLEELLRVGV